MPRQRATPIDLIMCTGKRSLGRAQAPEHRRAQTGNCQQLGDANLKPQAKLLGLLDQPGRGWHGISQASAEADDPRWPAQGPG